MSTYVILCWRHETPKDRPPDGIMGPFTRTQASRVMDKLTCRHSMWQITTEAPVWATT